MCSAAFVLAHTGLLDGRRATTHWRWANALAERFPKIQVDPDVLYIDHGDVATSAGTAAGVDLCLHLVQRDHGAASHQIARRMVMPPRRDGGQLQFASLSIPDASTDSLGRVLDWAVRRLADPISTADLAAYAGMSTRTWLDGSATNWEPAPVTGCSPKGSPQPKRFWRKQTSPSSPSPHMWASAQRPNYDAGSRTHYAPRPGPTDVRSAAKSRHTQPK